MSYCTGDSLRLRFSRWNFLLFSPSSHISSQISNESLFSFFMWLLIIWGLSEAGHALLAAVLLHCMLTCSCCPWWAVLASRFYCVEADAFLACSSTHAQHIVFLCVSNGALLCMSKGMGMMSVFFKCCLTAWKIWKFFRALLPIYCMTFSKLFRPRPKLFVLGNTYRPSARRREVEGCWEPGVWWVGGRILGAGRVLSLNNLAQCKSKVQGTGKFTFQASLLSMRVHTSSASQTGKRGDSIFLHPGMEDDENCLYH